jgi:hypothetical protein
MLRDIRLSLRQQRVFSRLSDLQDTHLFIMALIKRLHAMRLMLPEHVVQVEAGSESDSEFLTIS